MEVPENSASTLRAQAAWLSITIRLLLFPRKLCASSNSYRSSDVMSRKPHKSDERWKTLYSRPNREEDETRRLLLAQKCILHKCTQSLVIQIGGLHPRRRQTSSRNAFDFARAVSACSFD